MEVSNYTHCYSCKRFIDDIKVNLRKITVKDTLDSMKKICSDCYSGKVSGMKDVYYGYGSGTHTEENICDPVSGQPIPFSSKRGKWEAMQKAGVVEAGDKFRGARTTFTK